MSDRILHGLPAIDTARALHTCVTFSGGIRLDPRTERREIDRLVREWTAARFTLDLHDAAIEIGARVTALANALIDRGERTPACMLLATVAEIAREA